VKDELRLLETQLAAETPIQPFPDLAPSENRELVSAEDGYALLGCECCQCGRKFFPRRIVCLGCSSRELRDVSLGRYGRLYSFSTVHVSSSRATPYTIGYVDLDEGVRLLATVAGEAGELSPNVLVRLIRVAEEWAFAPVRERGTD
jgi:uncharacterized OB-fold protein